MKSWSKVNRSVDSYIQWIEYARLKNIKRTPSLDQQCTHTADWLEPTETDDRLIKVKFKKIVDGSNAESFDFNQVSRIRCNTLST